MFSIYLDDKPLWTPKDNDKRLLKPIVNLEVNKVGSASFSVLPGHARYNDFVKMKSIITIYQDDRVLFKGRVYGNSDDFYKTDSSTCVIKIVLFQRFDCKRLHIHGIS